MYLSPYDVTLIRGLNIGKIQVELGKRLVIKDYSIIRHPKEDEFVIAAIVNKDDVPLFNYPILIERAGQKPTYFIDLRSYTRFFDVNKDGSLDIKENTPAGLVVQLARLIPLWRNNANRVITFNQKPVIIFSRFLSETIGRKLGLLQTSPDAVIKLQILFAIYYQLSYLDADKIKHFELEQFTGQIARLLGLSYDFTLPIVSTIVKDFRVLKDMVSLCEFIRQSKWHMRLDKIQLRDLHAIMLSAGWFGGPNPKEWLLLSLEYPPIFLTMLSQSLENKSYKDTALSQIARRHIVQNHDVNDYLAKYNYLLAKG